MCGGGTYSLVEFRDLELAETALQFNGMELAGRRLKINYPTHFKGIKMAHRPLAPPTMPLRAPPELLEQYRVATRSSSSTRPMPTIVTGGERKADRKQRELFVGNLVAGSVRL